MGYRIAQIFLRKNTQNNLVWQTIVCIFASQYQSKCASNSKELRQRYKKIALNKHFNL